MRLLKDDVKAESDVALGDSADDEAVIGVDIKYDKVSSEGWEDGLGVLTVGLVNTYLYTVLSTDIVTSFVVTVK